VFVDGGESGARSFAGNDRRGVIVRLHSAERDPRAPPWRL
jgi:hypothetical protein